MAIRRAMTWLATVVVALAVALALPVSQLRTFAIVKTCCCPDPTDCHCPDHQPDDSGVPSIRACHNTERQIVAPQLPAFRPPAIELAVIPAIQVATVAYTLPVPHPAPPPRRPDAPS